MKYVPWMLLILVAAFVAWLYYEEKKRERDQPNSLASALCQAAAAVATDGKMSPSTTNGACNALAPIVTPVLKGATWGKDLLVGLIQDVHDQEAAGKFQTSTASSVPPPAPPPSKSTWGKVKDFFGNPFSLGF